MKGPARRAKLAVWHASGLTLRSQTTDQAPKHVAPVKQHSTRWREGTGKHDDRVFADKPQPVFGSSTTSRGNRE